MAHRPLRQSGIYCIRNIISGRIYVGSAINIVRRWNQHRCLLRNGKHHARILQRSWNKHGEAAFAFEILETVSEVTELVRVEQNWIDRLGAASNVSGFNVSPTAGSPLGTKHSIETRAKMSATRKGKKPPPFTEEHKQHIRSAKTGYKHSIESRGRMSVARRGRKLSPEHRQKLRAILTVRNRSPENRAKVSAARIGTKMSVESCRKRSLAMKGRKLPPRTKEHAANISSALRERYRKTAEVDQLILEF